MSAPKRGNPNWRKGGPSPNPGGRPTIATEFRRKAGDAVDAHVLKAWTDEVKKRGPNWMRASELLAAYGVGKPTVHVELNDITDPKQAPISELIEKLPEALAALGLNPEQIVAAAAALKAKQ